MTIQIFYFRSGEQKRMLARCQFGMFLGNPKAGATFTYPLQDYSWRYAIYRNYEFDIDLDTQNKMFDELSAFAEHPDNIVNDDLYTDFSEQANGISRVVATNESCHNFLIIDHDNKDPNYNYKQIILADNSALWLNSFCYKILKELFSPYEQIAEQFPKPQKRKLP